MKFRRFRRRGSLQPEPILPPALEPEFRRLRRVCFDSMMQMVDDGDMTFAEGLEAMHLTMDQERELLRLSVDMA